MARTSEFAEVFLKAIYVRAKRGYPIAYKRIGHILLFCATHMR
jgi:hypothetical protein